MDIIISLIGQIGSGKTYLANHLHSHYGYPVIRFSDFIIKYCNNNGIAINRKSLQEVGNLLIKTDASQFLQNVFEDHKAFKVVILEGIRHKEIFDLVNIYSQQHLPIYVFASDSKRLERYLGRQSMIDIVKNQAIFEQISSHPVEIEIQNLRSECLLEYDSEQEDFNSLIKSLNIMINNRAHQAG